MSNQVSINETYTCGSSFSYEGYGPFALNRWEHWQDRHKRCNGSSIPPLPPLPSEFAESCICPTKAGEHCTRHPKR